MQPDELARRLSSWEAFSALSDAQVAEAMAAYLPPLDRPECPAPAPFYARFASLLAGREVLTAPPRNSRPGSPYDPALCYVIARALYDPRFSMPTETPRGVATAEHVPGHALAPSLARSRGEEPAPVDTGPLRPARVMIVGKTPGRQDVQARTNFVGPAMQLLHDALVEAGVDAREAASTYVVNFVPFDVSAENTPTTLPKEWVAAGAMLLKIQVSLVWPDYILCLGADALKGLLSNKVTLGSVRGRYEPFAYDAYHRDGASFAPREALVTAVPHPTYIERNRPELRPEFLDYVARFVRQSRTYDAPGSDDRPRVHQVVTGRQQLRAAVDRALARPADPLVVAWDAEWEGQHPSDPGARLLSVQFSTAVGTATCVALVGDDGNDCFLGGPAAAAEELRRLVEVPGRRVRHGGHFFNGDVLWIRECLGIDLGPLVRVPDELPEGGTHAPLSSARLPGDSDCPPVPLGPWDLVADGAGGFDTGLAIKAVIETAGGDETNLKSAANRFCRHPAAYDADLDAAIVEARKRLKLSKDRFSRLGFGPVPRSILWPYACHDADAGRALYDPFFADGAHTRYGRRPLLGWDGHGLPSWAQYWSYLASNLAFREMEEVGVRLDLSACDALHRGFSGAIDRELAEVRRLASWPDFAPTKTRHLVELLFGDGYNRHPTSNEVIPRIRPAGAASLGFVPLKATDKFGGKEWDRLTPEERSVAPPSTDNATVMILLQRCEGRPDEESACAILTALQGLSAAQKMVSNLFGPLPGSGPDGASVTRQLRDGTEIPDYESGLAAFVAGDGRIHSRYYPIETGRAASAGPNLMNLAQRKESLYKTLLREEYRPARSAIVAREGCVLVNADWKGAELAKLAWASGDEAMIEDVRRNQLPEDDPDWHDIHGAGAVEAFGLGCAPTKAGLASIGKKSLRDAYKTVVFGTFYGRGDEAIAQECRVAGNPIAAVDARRMKEAMFARWPKAKEFLESAGSRLLETNWLMCSGYGLRRFMPTTEDRALKANQRAAGNFPIQGGVAFAMRRAMHNAVLFRERFRHPDGAPASTERPDRWYWIALQVHDSLDFEVPIPALPWFLSDVLPEVMVDRVPVRPLRLDGRPLHEGPDAPSYHFGLDYDVYFAWNVSPTRDQCLAAGVDSSLVPNLAKDDND